MDQETLKKYVKAGKIAAQVRKEGVAKLAVPGTSFLQVMDHCEKLILELGGEIAWVQMALNDVAAHYCPDENDTSVSKVGDLIKVDIGVHVDGYIADNAMTIEVGSHEYKDLIQAAQKALKATIKLVQPGRQLWELGEAQLSEAEAMGFTTIKNLCGHTLGRYATHGGISIPTYNNKDKTELKEGWAIAIEPFVTNGQGRVKDKGIPTVFMVEQLRSARTPYARKILDEIKSQNGLPFTTRWLTRKMGRGAAVLGLKELVQNKIIRPYPPLAEVSKGMVAQFEHSLIVQDKSLVYTKHLNDEW